MAAVKGTSVPLRSFDTSDLTIGYEEHGDRSGRSVVLLHGFPYDPRAYDAVAPALARHGCHVIVPYLRGYGPTRYRTANAFRSGEQAALSRDLIDLIDALALDRPILVGYDWGGRAACCVAALLPDRVGGLVAIGGYAILGRATTAPQDPALEHILWYQYYFHTHRGRMMLNENRRGFCRYIWRIWSPRWAFDDATYEETARSFDTDDFVEIVLHSYRHRAGLVPGDPKLAEMAARLEEQPQITTPVMVLQGDGGMAPPAMSENRSRFAGSYKRTIVAGAGHNLPQEAPEAVVAAVLHMRC